MLGTTEGLQSMKTSKQKTSNCLKIRKQASKILIETKAVKPINVIQRIGKNTKQKKKVRKLFNGYNIIQTIIVLFSH